MIGFLRLAPERPRRAAEEIGLDEQADRVRIFRREPRDAAELAGVWHPLARRVERVPESPVFIGVDTHLQFGATSGPPRGEDRPHASCKLAISRVPGEGFEPSRPFGQRILSASRLIVTT